MVKHVACKLPLLRSERRGFSPLLRDGQAFTEKSDRATLCGGYRDKAPAEDELAIVEFTIEFV